ncbi:MAG: O-antigen ligase family protein [Hydrogenophilus sp.]|nr:O-antigen ligase family protein [Hydrogenophilus sp.]
MKEKEGEEGCVRAMPRGWERWSAYREAAAGGGVLALATAVVWMQPLPGGPRWATALLWLIGLGAVARGGWRETPIPLRVAALFWVAFGGVIGASLVGAEEPSAGLGYGVAAIAWGAAVVGVSRGLKGVREGWVWLQRGVAVGFWGLLGDAWVQFAWGRDLFGVPFGPDYFEGRLVGPFADSLRLPVLLAVLFPVAVWPWRRRWGWVAMAWLACAWVVLLSGARSAVVLLVATSLPVVWGWPRRWQWGMLVGLTAVAVAAASVSEPLRERLVRSSEGVMAWVKGEDPVRALDTALSFRASLWRTAWRMGAEHPVLGVGAKQFAVVYPTFAPEGDPFREGDPYHAHHVWLGVWAELGGVGVLWLLGFVGVGGWMWWRARAELRERAAPWGAALGGYLFPLQSAPVLLSVWWWPVVWLLSTAFFAALSGEGERSDGGVEQAVD